MALSTCPEDVLFNIASYLHSNSPPAIYCTDLYTRVRIFGRLVLVCRHFCQVFTRLLYRTLCYTYEANTWPEEYQSLWFRQNPQRRRMAALYRTLSAVPALGEYTQFLEVRWDDHEGDSERLNDFLAKFPNLRVLDFSSSVVPHPIEELEDPDFVLEVSLTYLRTLRIDLPVFEDSLPEFFFLPNLETLEPVCLDPDKAFLLPVSPEAEPGRSKVAHLSLTANLNASQLLDILSWPYSLTSLTFIKQGCSVCPLDCPTVITFNTALQRFRHTLTTLNIKVRDDFFAPEPEDCLQDHSFPLLDTSLFHSLQELRAPSFLFTGPPGPHYTRSTIPAHLPTSLRTLELVFSPTDPFLFNGWHLWLSHYGHSATEKYDWLLALGHSCYPLGAFPRLNHITIRNDSPSTNPWYPPPAIRRIFFTPPPAHSHPITLETHLRVPSGMDGSDDVRYDEYYGARGPLPYFFFGDEDFPEWDGDPLFGDAQTEHSDSPRGSDDEDEDLVEELLEDEEWEQWDRVMAAEREREGRGREWRPGQWPDYGESREMREALFELERG
ncbi:hypothetical protein MMC30_003902 [Trapelia coarctata]|nr:hypothetical protein [Trapelia coarctata]